MSAKPPVVYLSHGAPPLADDPLWPGQLAAWGRQLASPSAILIVSAHWENAPPAVSATESGIPLVYDFWGFPEKYYTVTYPAPGAPALAESVAALLRQSGQSLHQAPARGLDHGAYVPLAEAFPAADIPVLQLSLPTLDPASLLRLGQTIAPLRDEGVLIVGSGFTTHNLTWFRPGTPADAPPPTVSSEFDAWARDTLAAGDIDQLIDVERRAPAATVAHPRMEHWAPIYVALGAAAGDPAACVIDGFWYGLSKRSWQFG